MSPVPASSMPGATIVAVASPKGGVGKTTVVANLAAALTEQGRHVIAIDLDPQNALRLHLQMPVDASSGLAPQALRGQPLGEACYESADGIQLYPYGTLAESDRRAFENLLGNDPQWLARTLAALAPPPGTVVLLDTPPGGSVYLQQALCAAQFALLVLLPDAASFVTVPSMERWLDEYCRGRADFAGSYYIVNRMNGARALCRDVLAALQELLGDRIVPHALHFDGLVEEALASQMPVPRYAPHSSAARDIGAIAGWLSARV